MKQILGIYSAARPHWVGDGFPVRTLFSYDSLGEHLSPFLLLDHAGPHAFGPSTVRRGVGQHPHRGFETVTLVYDGELEHRDSSGGGGRIGPGDVQWMTAGDGILHEEYHSPDFARSGGNLHMAQLWVNLPACHKRTAPAYQTLLAGDIPRIELADGAGSLRVIAGDYAGHAGPAHTFSPLDVWDLRLQPGRPLELAVKAGRNTALVVLRGNVRLGGGETLREGQLALFDRRGDSLQLEAESDALVLLLSGEPLDEPIVGYGPFVMNSESEIQQAIADVQNGRFGQMTR
ncbi:MULTISPECIES: pirin family protein [Pseudomonadaceae]|uniref:Pirin family protein n=1 Tax=Pseudomonas denitrificans TaxID=43306 RepID=A0A9X7MZQ5_PSEDE|nr:MULTISPECIES: pirin family protein [Pseudomonadaceae]MBD9517340.1 pirin family protein [Pseudomonas sp. PDM22]OQR33208.1 quercetin 2,3-dioxygenase [Pseudomonas sp. T]QEY72331.1 pirin family protein [Pseudomonas denitrificans (nom. rej.)]